MANVLEPAPTGRAKCRGCGEAIAKGALRFGESLPNPYAEGEALYWFHPLCGACLRPEAFETVLAANQQTLEDYAFLAQAVELGKAHPRVARIVRAERSPTNRARCRHCREVMDKGSFRLALQMFEEGRFSPVGFVHMQCSESYFGTCDLLDRIVRLTPALTSEDREEIAALLRHGPVAAAEPEGAGAGDMLAKTRPNDAMAETEVPHERARSSKH